VPHEHDDQLQADQNANNESFSEQIKLEQAMNAKYGEREGSRSMRPRKARDYAHLFTQAYIDSDTPLVTPQMSMKAGIKMFGEAGVEAVRKEMQQVHYRNVMEPKKATELTKEQKRMALGYLMFLKRKRCGRVKGRGCADGRKQRSYISKHEAASPTVSTEAVFLTALIDAHEEREVAVIDVPGAFMQADADPGSYVRFTGRMVEILLEIDEDMYGPCVTVEKGELVLYVELLKALYGTLRAARLFWEKLTSKLKEWGFTMNPYDACVANKMVNGKQLTVAWHVDDLKVSHVEGEVVSSFIKDMEAEFGKEAPLNKSEGKIHDYLGMILDYSTPGELKINMIDYIKTVLHDVPEELIAKRATTPASTHLFTVNEENPDLPDDKAEIFVHAVMQLLYLSQRARPDIRTAISFLCGRLKQPDVDDYKKLGRVLGYLRSTIEMPLILRSDGDGRIRWWVDASFAVHGDMRGHTGATMSLGAGSVYSMSSKQKLNTRSSTEAEVVGVHDAMPQLVWTNNFLRAQGINVDETILYQDNMSSILLEKNGRSSSTKRTRHMNIRYFCVKDLVDKKEISIEHCPTDEMLGDFFTKAVQGTKFQVMRDQIMGIVSNERRVHADPKECVEPITNCTSSGTETVFEVGSGTERHVAESKTYAEALRQGITMAGSF